MIQRSLRNWRARALAAALAFSALCCSDGDGGNGRGFRGGKSGIVGECTVPTILCPDSGVPSYVDDVLPILTARCIGCHGNGGEAVSKDFTTLKRVKTQMQGIRDQISYCQMPPPPLSPLSEDERATVITWIACGTPN